MGDEQSHGRELNGSSMDRLKRELVRAFALEGVVRVEFVTAFSEPFDFWAWLGTRTDSERDQLAHDATVDARIRASASGVGITSLYKGFTVESQETVDRDFEGSWFYRMR